MYYFKYNTTQNITSVKLQFSPFSPQKKKRLAGYKYIMNPPQNPSSRMKRII
jgi:hypothetical protein